MINLETSYMGLMLKNPLIASSSGITNSVEKIQKIEQAGAGAVVLKSLFEEQINYEVGSLLQYNDYPEAEDYIKNYAKNNNVDEYLKLIESAKKTVKIPIIPSINCVSALDWTDFAIRIEEAGADALELNIYIIPTERNLSGNDLEKKYYNIVKTVSSKISIPVAVKIGSHYSNLVHFVDGLHANGASAAVLFNRFYEPDIDIDNLKVIAAEVFSTPGDIRHSLRWVAMLSGSLKQMEISASTGIHGGQGAVKQLLAGAQTVQVCSTLYRHGIKQIKNILEDIESWMKRSGYKRVEEFRGLMAYKNMKDSLAYERSQFMRYFSSIE